MLSAAGAVTAGGVVSRTTMVAVDTAAAPWLSVTVSVTSCVPIASVVVTAAAFPSVTVPSVQRNVSESPGSGSDPDPDSDTAAPAGDVASNGAYAPAFPDRGRFTRRAPAKGARSLYWPHIIVA